MAHYFDDIFQRQVGKVPHPGGGRRHIRRSSTARSIGARSDFDFSVNGTDDDARSVANSVHHDDPERAKEKEEADSHMHRYISDQLHRYTQGEENGYEGDELESRAE